MPGPEAQDSGAGTEPCCAVLAFHKIGRPPAGGWDTWNYIAEDTFAAQLELLDSEGFVVLDLDGFLEGLADPDRLPPRSALLTFDDGYRTMLSVAQPILARFGFPAVCFVPTGFVGELNSWDQDNEPEEAICDWDELRELERLGVRIQSHSVSHPHFSELDEASLSEQLDASRQDLQERLGTSVDTLAFPYGDAGDPALIGSLLARAGYRAAFRYKGGICAPRSAPPFRLPRVPMGPDTNLRAWLRGERR